ncbi:4Fe-4S dicluster domain-containing protein [Desulfovibrio sp. OttesenSCG-928-I05]|nr:4Fe-4S dicluster domain-containing protein [Desulfovibrio sp. OttesenSCG-928-I05]
MKRRQFLKAALATSTLALVSALPEKGQAVQPGRSGYGEPETALKAGRWAMVIDTNKMNDPRLQQQVIHACHSKHNVPDIQGTQEVKWIWTDSYEHTFPDVLDNYPAKTLTDRSFLLLCNHCENPPCVRVCPTQATFQREDGIVVMDYHRCIGCRFCMAGCPYGARSFNFSDPQPYVKEPNLQFPMRMRGVVEKCTFCSERLAKGELPYCVEASEGGILFGDLNDPGSSVRKALEASITIRRKPSLGTQPGVYYIL